MVKISETNNNNDLTQVIQPAQKLSSCRIFTSIKRRVQRSLYPCGILKFPLTNEK